MGFSALAISLSGMQNAQLHMDAVAHNVANAATKEPVISRVSATPRPNGQGVQTYVRDRESVMGVDLASEFVTMKLAQTSYAANAQAASTASHTLGTLIDMIDTAEDER